MDERRPHPASKIKMIANFDYDNLVTEQITKSVEESLGVGRRNFLQPLKQVDSNKSVDIADREGSQAKNNKGKLVKEEPTTPRSRQNSFSFKRFSNGCQDENIDDRYNCTTTGYPTNRTQSSVIRKKPDLDAENSFKIKCDLRISISNTKNTSLPNRRVYAMDCDEDCEKFAETQDNPHGKFENCYKSSFTDWVRTNFDSEKYYAERCELRVSIAKTPFHNRQVHVFQCCGNCGKFCENEMFENYAECTDIDQSFLY